MANLAAFGVCRLRAPGRPGDLPASGKAVQAGASAFLAKPFGFEMLNDATERAIRPDADERGRGSLPPGSVLYPRQATLGWPRAVTETAAQSAAFGQCCGWIVGLCRTNRSNQ